VLERLVSRPKTAVIVLCAVVLAGVLVEPHLERGFLPEMDEGAFVLDYFLPAGTSLVATDAAAKDLEAELRATPEVRTFTRRLGAELGPAAATLLNRGDIMVVLAPANERSRGVDAIIADVRARVEARVPQARVEFVQVLQDVLNDLSGNPRPLELKVFGPDYAKAHEIADALAARVKPIAGVVDLYDGTERAAPELRFAARRDAIALLGTTPDAIGAELEAALLGSNVGSVRRFDRLVGVRVRYPDPVRYDPEQVLRMPYRAGDKTTLFSAVSDVETSTAPSQLLHEAMQPVVAVTADVEGRDIGSIADEVERVTRDVPVPSGYRVVLGGQAQSQRDTLKQLAVVGGLALVLVLTILAMQFRRLGLAFLVLASTPVAIVGALATLLVTRTPLNASSLMGCVLLVGLVVKNGVLLLEEAEHARDAGEGPTDAVLRAAERRLRPVLMTTVATVAGLFPLALGIGAGAELQRPLAIAVIGGLVTATLATLCLLPPLAAVVLKRARPFEDQSALRTTRS
ncbi:MAG: efflux RND transporter permease subunit, partial [Polyangiaceae bacterium]